MKTVTVIIPVYLTSLSQDEELSFRRTLKILKGYPITLICPKSLNLSVYEELAEKENKKIYTERFNDNYFNGIEGYNRLMLSYDFYHRFESYEYILICQLDAYIFKDELQEWCDKGYDFIGAPLIGRFEDTVFSENMRVGNGGLSLRKVHTYTHFFQSKKNVFTIKQIADRIQLGKKPYTRVFVLLLMIMGWRNKPSSVAKGWAYNEDDFWSGQLDKSRYALSKPEPVEAIQFSFERFPAELFELNAHNLPFGCHAWRKYQYDSFWKRYLG